MIPVASIGLIVSGLNAVLDAAPGVYEVAAKVVKLVESLFQAGAISAQVQNALFEQVNAKVKAHLEAAMGGPIPEGYDIEPDPGMVIPDRFKEAYPTMSLAEKLHLIEGLRECPDGSCFEVPGVTPLTPPPPSV